MVVTLVLTGLPHNIPLYGLKDVLDQQFPDGALGDYTVRDLSHLQKNNKRQVALDFDSGFDAMPAQELLDKHILLSKNCHWVLHAKVTNNKDLMPVGNESFEVSLVKYSSDRNLENTLASASSNLSTSRIRSRSTNESLSRNGSLTRNRSPSHSSSAYNESIYVIRKERDEDRHSDKDSLSKSKRSQQELSGWLSSDDITKDFVYFTPSGRVKHINDYVKRKRKYYEESLNLRSPSPCRNNSKNHSRKRKRLSRAEKAEIEREYSKTDKDNKKSVGVNDRLLCDAIQIIVDDMALSLENLWKTITKPSNSRIKKLLIKLQKKVSKRMSILKLTTGMNVKQVISCYRAIYPESQDHEFLIQLLKRVYKVKNEPCISEDKETPVPSSDNIWNRISDVWEQIDDVLDDISMDMFH